MMYQEFNRIAGKECDPNMYDKEIEPIYMEFGTLTKKEIAVLYWGEKKGAYALWLELKDLMRYINALNEVTADGFGLVEHMASIKITEKKFELIEKVKALKIK